MLLHFNIVRFRVIRYFHTLNGYAAYTIYFLDYIFPSSKIARVRGKVDSLRAVNTCTYMIMLREHDNFTGFVAYLKSFVDMACQHLRIY